MKRNKKEKNVNQKKGISLIVLIITIIVIVVLAVAVILSIANNNPISNANKAKAANNESALLEAANLAYTSIYADKQIKGKKIDYNEITNEVRNSLLSQGFSSDDVNKVIITEKGVQITIEHIIEKELQGKNIYAENVNSNEHNVEVSLESDVVTDFSTVEVRELGVNLFDYNKLETTEYISFESYENGKITVKNQSETSTKEANFIIENLPAGTYTLSHEDSSKLFVNRKYNGTDSWTDAIICDSKEKNITLSDAGSVKIKCFVAANSTITLENVQFEIGDKKTEYKEYIERKFTPISDGKVEGIKSISPIMTILTNNKDVTIKCKYKKNAEEIYTSKVKGKKMAIIGDSISYGSGSFKNASGEIKSGSTLENPWWKLVQNRYEIGEVINNSVIGAAFTKDISSTAKRFTTYLNSESLPQDLDIIVVFGGTNDYSQNCTLGTTSDAATTENNVSFCAAVKATLEYLTENFPNSEIIYFTPLPRWSQTGEVLTDDSGNYYIEGGKEFNSSNDAGYFLEDYVKKIKELCTTYNVNICDLYTTSGMNMGDFNFKLQYAPDGLHPNDEGTKIYTENGIFPVLDKMWLVKEYK